MSHFEDLKVWQKAVDLAVKVYKFTNKETFKKYDFGLRDQMRRAAISISSNISEGDQMDSDKMSVRYLRISKGSTAELYTQAIIANKIHYLDSEDFEHIRRECKEILAMLANLISHRKQGGEG